MPCDHRLGGFRLLAEVVRQCTGYDWFGEVRWGQAGEVYRLLGPLADGGLSLTLPILIKYNTIDLL
jgi:hypothetical protein